MNTYWQARATAISLTTAALLGGSLLAGCGHSAPAAQGASATITSAQTTVSAGPSATSAGSTVSAGPSATPVKSTAAAEPSAAPVKSTAEPSATRPAALSASELLSATEAAIASGGSVHNDATITASGTTLHYTVDATPTGGRQVLTIGQAGQVTILLINGIGYVQGNVAGLESFATGLPAKQAAQFAGQWIEIRPGQKLGSASFSDVTGGLSLPSIGSSIALSGAPSLLTPTTIGGQPVDGLQGTPSAADGLPAPATAVLYVAQSTRLPVLMRIQSASYTGQMTFSRWHEPVDLTAPAVTIPATEVTPVPSAT